MPDKTGPKPKKPRKPREKTSASVASIAGKLLQGKGLLEAEQWLRNLLLWDTSASDEDRTCAMTLLGALDGMRKLAASALTQHEK